MIPTKPLNVLCICRRPEGNANAVHDSIDAFGKYSRHNVYLLPDGPEALDRVDLSRFDALILHYTVLIVGDPRNRKLEKHVAAFPGLKIQLIQDEYRHVDAIVRQMRELGIHLVFTCWPEDRIARVYPPDKLRDTAFVSCLTGYVSEGLIGQARPPIRERAIDVSYRSRKPSFCLGSLAVEKWKIADEVAARAEGLGLRLDLSYREEDRLYGEEWISLVRRSKTMLGVESGASVVDFTGELQAQVEAYERESLCPTFEEAKERFFKDLDGDLVINVISPRCFECACLGTAMILFEGEYSGVLKPWRHYVPLKKDFSNFDEVVAVVRNDERLQEIADRAYEDIVASGDYSYRRFVERFDDIAAARRKEKGTALAARPYSRFHYRRALITYRIADAAKLYWGKALIKLRFMPWLPRERVVVFGAGKAGEAACRVLSVRHEVIAFCDNDARKQGQPLLGLPVIPPSELRAAQWDAIWVASVYAREIEQQLKGMGLPADKVCIAGDRMIHPRSLPGLRWLLAGVAFLGIAGAILLFG